MTTIRNNQPFMAGIARIAEVAGYIWEKAWICNNLCT